MMEKLTGAWLDRHRDAGLLVLRLGIGVMFILHGWPKMVGGPQVWERLGGAMESLGVGFAPTFWGFMAALAELGGGLLLMAGLMTRGAAAMLLFTMIVAALKHITAGDPFPRISHPIEDGVVFLSLMVMGAGRWSLDARWSKRKEAQPPAGV